MLVGFTVRGDSCAWYKWWALRSAINSSSDTESTTIWKRTFLIPLMSFHSIDSSVGMSFFLVDDDYLFVMRCWIVFHIIMVFSILFMFKIVSNTVFLLAMYISEARRSKWLVYCCIVSSLVSRSFCLAMFSWLKMSEVYFHVKSIGSRSIVWSLLICLRCDNLVFV